MMWTEAAPQASSFDGQKVVTMGLKKDLAKMSSFLLNSIIAIALQGEDDVFGTCVPNIISGKSLDASWMHLKGS